MLARRIPAFAFVVAASALIGCTGLILPQPMPTAAPVASAQPAEGMTPAAGERSEDGAAPAATKPSGGAIERALSVGGQSFTIKLPCNPTSDKAESDASDQGPLTFTSHACDDEASGLSFMILTAKYERALASSADRNAKSSAISKSFAAEACKAFKDAKTKCTVGTPMVASGVATVNVKIVGGDDKLTLRVSARYPYAAALLIGGDDSAALAKTASASLTLPSDAAK